MNKLYEKYLPEGVNWDANKKLTALLGYYNKKNNKSESNDGPQHIKLRSSHFIN